MFLHKVLFLFYRYYDQGATKQNAYIRTRYSFGGLLSMNVWSILFVSGIADEILKPLDDLSQSTRYWVIGFCYVVPTTVILWALFPRKKILEVEMSVTKEKKGGLVLLLYIILSFVILITAIVYNHRRISY